MCAIQGVYHVCDTGCVSCMIQGMCHVYDTGCVLYV